MTIDAQTLNAGPSSEGSVDPSTAVAAMSSPDAKDLPSGPKEEVKADGPASSEETLKTDGQGTEDQGGKEGSPEKKEGEDEVPWHKDPRWQKFKADKAEVEAEKARIFTEKESIEAEKARIQELRAGRGVGDKDERGQGRLNFKNIAQMSDEELKEWQEDDPKGYAANLYAQIEHELTLKMKRDREEEDGKSKVFKTLDEYKAKNHDFIEMANNGEIKKFIDEHPGHNALSAHMAITEEKRIAKAVQEAVAKKEKEMLANFQAKKESRVLGSGPAVAGASSGVDKELTNTKEHGGKEAVQAGRLARLRRIASG